MGDRFAARFLIPGGLWLLAVLRGAAGDRGGDLVRHDRTTSARAIYGWYPENYSRAFDPLFVPVLLRSVGYAMATVVLCLLLGYPVAYYIARFGGRHKNVLIALVVLPFFVNYLVRTYAWVAILSDEGILNGLLGARRARSTFLNNP